MNIWVYDISVKAGLKSPGQLLLGNGVPPSIIPYIAMPTFDSCNFIKTQNLLDFIYDLCKGAMNMAIQ